MNKIKSVLYWIIVLTVCAACTHTDKDLLAYYTFDELAEGKLLDVSGNGQHAVLHGGELVTGIKGNAVLFTGGYAEVAYDSCWDHFEKGITISAWVFRDTSSSWNCIITRETKDNWSEYFDLGCFQNQALFSVDGDGASFVKTTDTIQLPVHEWVFMAGTFDNTRYSLYINGTKVSSAEKEMRFRFSDKNPILIAGNTNDQGKSVHDFFYGKLDELKVYRRALTEQEVQKEYKLLSGSR